MALAELRHSPSGLSVGSDTARPRRQVACEQSIQEEREGVRWGCLLQGGKDGVACRLHVPQTPRPNNSLEAGMLLPRGVDFFSYFGSCQCPQVDRVPCDAL